LFEDDVIEGIFNCSIVTGQPFSNPVCNDKTSSLWRPPQAFRPKAALVLEKRTANAPLD
jgi:hypothetical protein